MEKVFQSKFNYLSAIIVLCLTAYFAYLFIESSFSLVILLTLSYILLAKIVKYSYFKESSLEVRFPLNFIGKRIVIDYKDVKSVETGAGSYLDGSILVIRYFRGDSVSEDQQ